MESVTTFDGFKQKQTITKLFRKDNVIEGISYLFILLFVYTAIYKFFDFTNFTAVIGQSPLITKYANLLAYAVPITEIIVSLLLAFPKTRLIGLCASFDLMLCFTAYIIILLTLSIHLPCSCGGVIQKMTWPQHLVFNIIFTSIALWGIVLYSKESKKF